MKMKTHDDFDKKLQEMLEAINDDDALLELATEFARDIEKIGLRIHDIKYHRTIIFRDGAPHVVEKDIHEDAEFVIDMSHEDAVDLVKSAETRDKKALAGHAAKLDMPFKYKLRAAGIIAKKFRNERSGKIN